MNWIDLQHGKAVASMPLTLTVEGSEAIEAVAEKISALHNQEKTMVAIQFAKFSDGRGFSLAHLLRRQYGFKGGLVAVGAIPDQAQFLYRSGFDWADIGMKKMEDWQMAVKKFSVSYQQSIRPLPKGE